PRPLATPSSTPSTRTSARTSRFALLRTGDARRTPAPATVGIGALVAVTMVWGSTFPLLKDALDRIPAADLLTVRFAVATVALLALRPTALVGMSRRTAARAAVLGLLYGVAQVLQTVGLGHTSASVSGFVTSAYVVLTPVLGALLLRRRPPRAVWLAVGMSTVGIGVLSLRGLAVGPGEALTLLSAAFFALHILGLGAWASAKDAFGVTVVQLAVVTVVSGAAAVPGGLTLPHGTADLLAVGYLAVVAGAGAVLVQTWAQAHVAPERAAVVMTLEPVWAAAFSVALLGETLGPRVVVGGAAVLAAMVVCERPDVVARLAAALRPLGQRLPDVVGPRDARRTLRVHGAATRTREGRQPGPVRGARPACAVGC
ncbi:DMT family transporter, partial [Kineosporia sp. R_H_3]|uniref:DMT family transporter n=1 Tax=Kineosporia sp. R_H_3 TaxID=1961848 RepID=UPI0018E95A66